MIELKRRTTYSVTTTSREVYKAIKAIADDPKCRELALMFAAISSRKRRNVLLRMAYYLRAT